MHRPGATHPSAFRHRHHKTQDGSALIAALWVILVLSLIVGSFAFEMHLEGRIASHERKKFKSEYLARAGMAYAEALLDIEPSAFEEEFDPEDPFQLSNKLLQRGVPVVYTQQFASGSFSVRISPEEEKRNVNLLTPEEWHELLDLSGVTDTLQREELIDCFIDWTDEGDLHQLNGAESDDPFYEERGYECKNAPLDTVDELLLIKGFTRAIVYGGTDEDENTYTGIAQYLTVWGSGATHLNAASREVLLSMPDLDEDTVDAIIEDRTGADGEEGTEDDGFESLEETGLNSKDFTVSSRFVKVLSTGDSSGVRFRIYGVFHKSGEGVIPVFWQEGIESEHENNLDNGNLP